MTQAIRQNTTRNWNRRYALWIAASLAFAFVWAVSVAKDSFAAPLSSAMAPVASKDETVTLAASGPSPAWNSPTDRPSLARDSFHPAGVE